jgi:ribosomal protein L34E
MISEKEISDLRDGGFLAGGSEGDIDAIARAMRAQIAHAKRASTWRRCEDCSVDVHEIRESYMVRREIWERSGIASFAFLCIGCLERRIGRKLCRRDFIDAPINNQSGKSDRLRDRLMGTG